MEVLTDKIVTFKEVQEVLRVSLALEDNVKITPNTKIVELGAEPIDILDIYFNLGMNFSNYTSGEKFNDKFRSFLKEIMLDSLEGDYALHIADLAGSNTTNYFIDKLTVKDLMTIKKYEEKPN